MLYKRHRRMIHNHLKMKSLIAILGLFFAFNITAQVDAKAGKTLFRNYCAQCHNKDMKTAMTGPALGGAQERWGDDEALYSWIRNSQAMIAAGHPRAVELWNEWKPTVMTAYPDLTDDRIGSVLAYVAGTADGTLNPKPVGGLVDVLVKEESSSNFWYWILFALLVGLSLTLLRVIGNLDQLNAEKEGKSYKRKSLIQSITSSGLVSILIFALVLLAGYTTVNNAMNLGRQQGYQPDQPIAFSHATHAGLHKIDCQYCHDGARRSKHAVIPATNTCMNCHSAIKVGSQYGTAELSKIYASSGWDPNTGTYIEGYDDMAEEDIKAIFTKWITENYKDEKEVDVLDESAMEEIEGQWNNIVTSLTNEQKKTVQGPIEWTRVHNLPDHVYFNHAQHVTAGKVECQTCHGAVEEMDVLKQDAPLSMGWCINCHRQTEVQFNENDYYKDYAKYHEEIQSGERDKVTVADIGGLECQKCHY